MSRWERTKSDLFFLVISGVPRLSVENCRVPWASIYRFKWAWFDGAVGSPCQHTGLPVRQTGVTAILRVPSRVAGPSTFHSVDFCFLSSHVGWRLAGQVNVDFSSSTISEVNKRKGKSSLSHNCRYSHYQKMALQAVKKN